MLNYQLTGLRFIMVLGNWLIAVIVFSSEAMEERYEHKTRTRIQEVVRIL